VLFNGIGYAWLAELVFPRARQNLALFAWYKRFSDADDLAALRKAKTPR
jgi:hypothetical protein